MRNRHSSVLVRVLLACLCFCIGGCSSGAPRQQSVTPMPTAYVSQPQSPPSPQTPPPVPKSQQPIVFLDAGHGGRETGAVPKGGRLQEKMLNLEVVKRIERLLLGWGYTVAMSRRQDVTVSLRKRVTMAARDNATIFVSIHFNSAPSRKGRGAEIFYFNTPNSQRCTDSKRLGSYILRRLCDTLPTRSRGVKHGDLCVIRETTMPAVLVEPAFLTNPKDSHLLASPPYKQQIAWAVAKGIKDYFSESRQISASLAK